MTGLVCRRRKKSHIQTTCLIAKTVANLDLEVCDDAVALQGGKWGPNVPGCRPWGAHQHILQYFRKLDLKCVIFWKKNSKNRNIAVGSTHRPLIDSDC